MTSARFPFLVALALTGFANSAHAIDWSKVQGKDITLLYPAQMSWELVLTQAEHSGASKFREGKNCRGCHEGNEDSSGDLMVGDKTIEPTPIAGKPGFVKANVKFAHDDQNLFMRVEFAPGKQPDAKMDPKIESRVAVMLDDGKVMEFSRGGCWAACHIDNEKMPKGTDGVSMYLPKSRNGMTREGGGVVKPADELAKIQAEGGYAEYWEASLNPGMPATVIDGIVLDKRKENAAPAVTANATFDNGKWTVEFSRKLSADANHKDIGPGKLYTFGIAIHAGHTNKRFHYVSLEKTFTVDTGNGDFIAKKAP
ncbi:MAG: cytochrome c-552 precursor [Rhodospirillaceae bacterium]|nr:cytochrome c-552 precursor [Rhodospirillaceae bacterium]